MSLLLDLFSALKAGFGGGLRITQKMLPELQQKACKERGQTFIGSTNTPAPEIEYTISLDLLNGDPVSTSPVRNLLMNRSYPGNSLTQDEAKIKLVCARAISFPAILVAIV